MRIAKEEIFGRYYQLFLLKQRKAVNIVNDTSYGLEIIYKQMIEKAHRVAKKLRSECVYINGNN